MDGGMETLVFQNEWSQGKFERGDMLMRWLPSDGKLGLN